VRRLPVLALLISVFSLVSCHHYTAPASTAIVCTTTASTTPTTTSSSSCSDPVTGISIAIAPPSVSVIVATPTQFQAGVSSGTVTWQVNGVAKGNDTVGTIDFNGKYIAPSMVPSPATVTVAAVSFEDPKLSVTSTVTILQPPLVTISPTCTLVAPCTLTSGTANTKTFTATVTGAPTKNVDWQVNGVGGGNATFGTIDSNGVYTAPLTPPIGSSVTVTAVSRDFPLSSDSAKVTISGFSTSSFQGQFAFSLSGRNTSGAFFRAGSFAADGRGNLTSGLEDINDASGPTTTPISFVGAYTIAADGRGTLQFSDGRSSSTPGAASTFRFVPVNSDQLQIIGSDTNETATGQANLQDLSAFNASGLFSTYVFDFAGVHGGSALSQIGEFTSDGLGNITNGLMDINDGVAITPKRSFTGSYVTNSNGQGTATLIPSSGPALKFSFYIVSRGSAKFVEIDAAQATAGVTMQQAPNATFGATPLSGNYAFLLEGSVSSGTIATAGSFSANGANVIGSGVLDENVGGAPNSGVTISAGSYTMDPNVNGRGVATFTASSRGGSLSTTYTFVFYLGSTGSAVFQETDSGITSDGIFTQQQSTAFSVAFNKGNNYAISTSGISGGAVQVITGQLGTDGAGNIAPGAAIDINSGGALASGQTVTGLYTAPAAATGRAMLTLNPGNRMFAEYVVNSTQVYVLEIDNTAGQLAAGALLRQF
jgi:hypothetical protein